MLVPAPDPPNGRSGRSGSSINGSGSSRLTATARCEQRLAGWLHLLLVQPNRRAEAADPQPPGIHLVLRWAGVLLCLWAACCSMYAW